MVEHEITGPVDRVSWLISRVAMWIVGLIIAIMAFEVTMRYVFERPTIWANEMSLWLAGMVYLFAGLYAMQQRSHIRIYILYDLAPHWLRKTFDVISTICLLLFALAVIWGGYGEAYAKFMRWETFGTAFDPPIPATMKPLLLITMLLLSVQAVSNLINDWHTPPESHSVVDDIDEHMLVDPGAETPDDVPGSTQAHPVVDRAAETGTASQPPPSDKR